MPIDARDGVGRALFALYERARGRRSRIEAERLTEAQWIGEDELKRHVEGKLSQLLVHCYSNVPYYHKLMRRHGVDPRRADAWAALNALPPTDKQTMRREFPAGILASSIPEKRRLPRRTSGATGTPFQFYLDRRALDLWQASHYVFDTWHGIEKTNALVVTGPVFHRFNTVRAKVRARLKGLLLGGTAHYLHALGLTLAQFLQAVEHLASQDYYIVGYPSVIARLARQIEEQSVQLPKYPKLVLTDSETKTEFDDAQIRRAFRCPTISFYRTSEFGPMAATCPEARTIFHVDITRVIVEAVRPDGSPAAPGEDGRVLVTDLHNEVMPFVRYEIGDVAAPGGPCRCGRGLPTLAHIQGRTAEQIVTSNGKHFSAGLISQFLIHDNDFMPFISEWQAIQASKAALRFLVVGTDRYDAEVGRRLQEGLAGFLGPDMDVRVEAVDRIETQESGKRLVVKSLQTPRAGPGLSEERR